MKKITINNEDVSKRLDVFLRDKLPDFKRKEIVDNIDNGLVLVNGKTSKASYKIRPEDVIEIDELKKEEKFSLKGEDNPLNIVYEDEDIIVINKERGMVVHPSIGHRDGTLVNSLIYHISSLPGNEGFRPGIVHRIDKDTSGLLVCAKNENAMNYLSQQIKDHKVERKYIALVNGNIKEEQGKIIAPLMKDRRNIKKMKVDTKEGKNAITYYKVLHRYGNYTLLELKLETGRTHQIRAHLEYIGHPIEGDPVYGKGNNKLVKDGQLLHAYQLTLSHPKTKEKMDFKADLPVYFKNILDQLS